MIGSRLAEVRKPFLMLLIVGLASCSLIGKVPGDEAAAVTRDQLEKDWLLQARLRSGVTAATGSVTLTEDAAGGCDGVINGKWGFHTALEDDPWWQVDLGQASDLESVTIYNRCDRLSERNSHIEVLLSADGKHFATVYRHDGTVFLGQPDKKPLVVPLAGRSARFVRLHIPGHNYFHLDEVQVWAAGHTKNIALGQPATQSSVSQWSQKHAGVRPLVDWPTVLATTISRGRRLSAVLTRQGVDTGAVIASLDAVDGQLDALKREANDARWQTAYFRVRSAIRQLALANPVLDFDSILFVKRAPSMFPHLSDQYYGWWARPGGGLFVLDGFKSGRPVVHCLTDSWPEGNFLRPDLSYDAGKAIVAFSTYHAGVADIKNKRDKNNLPEDVFYQLYEIDLATGSSRQLTHGKYDDFDGRYLPDGEIVFLSTRKGQFIQTSRANTLRTLESDLPDSYVRCGGGDYRPVPVFTLHSMSRDGSTMKPISAFETFEYTPSVAEDGRILYCRWDYIDRFNGFFFSLWSTNPDGTNPQLVYGNVTKRPQATFEPRSIPGSDKIVFTAAAHHSITGGSLVLFDPSIGYEGEEPITRLTPEVPFPEVERNVEMYYANPWPLSEDFYLVSWSARKLPPHGRYEDDRNPVNAQGIYLYDRFGNLELLYRDPRISSMTPIPVRPRRRPPVLSSRLAWDGKQLGTMVLQDIYQGLPGLEPGSVKRLRIVGVLPKVQPQMNQPSLGVSREETGKFVIGTVPVQADGSAYFLVPSGVSLFFQALDAGGFAVQTMRSLTYVQPGQHLSCIGCHERRQTSPAPQSVLALQRGPSKIEPEVEGTWPLRFDTLVQPVLNAHCVECHSGLATGEPHPGSEFNLTDGQAWATLIHYANDDLHKLVFERDVSLPGQSPAKSSKLLQFLATDGQHGEISLSGEDMRRLITWIDIYGQTMGSFSDQQERQLAAFRDRMKDLFE